MRRAAAAITERDSGRNKHRPKSDRPSWLPTGPTDWLDDLRDYASPDCVECHGRGHVGREPCPLCIVEVWG